MPNKPHTLDTILDNLVVREFEEVVLVTDDDITQAKASLIDYIESLVGTEWHHNSEAWCAGANARRKHILANLHKLEDSDA